MSDRLILDTCAIIWLALGGKSMSKSALEAVRTADPVYVSPISAWEISMKYERGSIELPMAPLEWFSRILVSHDLTLAPLDVETLIASNALPWHHKDPADRFIIATAMRLRLAIVTGDKLFSKYDIPIIPAN